MFMLLAVGEATDISKPPYSPLAEKYRQLGRAALALDCAFESATIPTVQAMVRPFNYLLISADFNP